MTSASKRLLGSRDEELPARFTDDECRAYKWLWDCGVNPWLVDLLTKEVTTPEKKWPDLVTFAKHHGMDDDRPPLDICPRCGQPFEVNKISKVCEPCQAVRNRQ